MAMQSAVIVPVSPGQRGEFELVNGLPRSSPWSSHEFGLVEGVDTLGQRVDAPICQELIMQPLKEQFWHGNLSSLDRRLLER